MTATKHRIVVQPALVAGDFAIANEDDDAVAARLDGEKLRARWRAKDDAEELYLRRCSEVSTHQMLDGFGVPHGELSLNGRLAWLENAIRVQAPRLRGTDSAPLAADAGLDQIALLLPGGEWRLATSGVSADCGAVRVRSEGGSRAEREAVVRFLLAARSAAVEG